MKGCVKERAGHEQAWLPQEHCGLQERWPAAVQLINNLHTNAVTHLRYTLLLAWVLMVPLYCAELPTWQLTSRSRLARHAVLHSHSCEFNGCREILRLWRYIHHSTAIVLRDDSVCTCIWQCNGPLAPPKGYVCMQPSVIAAVSWDIALQICHICSKVCCSKRFGDASANAVGALASISSSALNLSCNSLSVIACSARFRKPKFADLRHFNNSILQLHDSN